MNQVLFDAIEYGNREKVRELLTAAPHLLRDSNFKPVKLNDDFTAGCTCLAYAVFRDERAIIRMLLEAGASADEPFILYSSDEVGNLYPEIEEFYPLHLAAFCGHVGAADCLLSSGVSCETKDSRSYTPLHWAGVQAKPEMIELLLAWGADINSTTSDCSTPLHLAVISENIDTVNALLDKKPNINALADTGQTPLSTAILTENIYITMLLAFHGAQVNAPSPGEKSPLELAVQLGNTDIVEILLKKGADIHHNGCRMLFYAPTYEIVQLLESHGLEYDFSNIDDPVPVAWTQDENTFKHFISKGLPANTRSFSGKTLLFRAPGIEIVDLLLSGGADIDAGDEDGNTALLYALEFQREEIVEHLVKKGADITVRDREGRTALHAAANWFGENDRIIQLLIDKGIDINARDRYGNPPLFDAWEVNTVRQLESLGADLHARNNKGHTILHVTAHSNNQPVMGYLLDRGFDPDVIDYNGKTPLEMALTNDCPQAFELLIQHGADIHYGGGRYLFYARDRKTADCFFSKGLKVEASHYLPQINLTWAYNDELFKLFLDQGVDIFKRDYWGDTLLHFSSSLEYLPMLISRGLDIEAKNKRGKTPLLSALSFGNYNHIKRLIELGADVNSSDNTGTTCLHNAVINSDESTKIVELLISAGAQINSGDDRGATPLHHAAENTQVETGKLLLTHGADINALDNEGLTPLQWTELANTFYSCSKTKVNKMAEFLKAQGGKPGPGIARPRRDKLEPPPDDPELGIGQHLNRMIVGDYREDL